MLQVHRIHTRRRWIARCSWLVVDLATVALFIAGVVLMLSGAFPGLLVVFS